MKATAPSPKFAYVYDKNTTAQTVLLHEKQHTVWHCTGEWPAPFTCAVTGLKYYAGGACHTCADVPDVLISAEGMAQLRSRAYSFLR